MQTSKNPPVRIPHGLGSALTSEQRQAIEDFYNALHQQDLALVNQAATEDWEDIPLAPGQGPGPEGVKPIFRMLFTALPDLSLDIVDVIAEKDRAAVRLTVKGSHLGALFGVPASGKAVTFSIHEFHEFAGGRVCRTWHMEDLLGLFRQIGAWPNMPPGDDSSQT